MRSPSLRCSSSVQGKCWCGAQVPQRPHTLKLLFLSAAPSSQPTLGTETPRGPRESPRGCTNEEPYYPPKATQHYLPKVFYLLNHRVSACSHPACNCHLPGFLSTGSLPETQRRKPVCCSRPPLPTVVPGSSSQVWVHRGQFTSQMGLPCGTFALGSAC